MISVSRLYDDSLHWPAMYPEPESPEEIKMEMPAAASLACGHTRGEARGEARRGESGGGR